MKALRIYIPEGSASFTRRVAASDVETHIAANDQHAYEAGLLREFREADEIPDRLGDGKMVKDSEGRDEHGDYVRYVEGTATAMSRRTESEIAAASEAIAAARAYDHERAALKAAAMANPTASARLAEAANSSGLTPARILMGYGVLGVLASGAEARQINTPDLVSWEVLA